MGAAQEASTEGAREIGALDSARDRAGEEVGLVESAAEAAEGMEGNGDDEVDAGVEATLADGLAKGRHEWGHALGTLVEFDGEDEGAHGGAIAQPGDAGAEGESAIAAARAARRAPGAATDGCDFTTATRTPARTDGHQGGRAFDTEQCLVAVLGATRDARSREQVLERTDAKLTRPANHRAKREAQGYAK